MNPWFLGLDCSTQSLTAVIIDWAEGKLIYERSVNFDRDLPDYQTEHGTLKHPDPLRKHSPPKMWAEALDLLFQQMCDDGIPLHRIAAVSGSAQQHGSVYLNGTGVSKIGALNPSKGLKQNLQGGWSRATAPIWMDSSTSEECEEMRAALGGTDACVEAMGSDLFERFTAPQIRKFYKDEPKGYADTAAITLVSSFMASLLSGRLAPIDHCDASGMSLMDIRRKVWLQRALNASAPFLAEKLPPLASPWDVVGPLSPYFVQRYGCSAAAISTVWSGDNPCSMVGLGVIQEGDAAVSLGTSFTYFAQMNTIQLPPKGEGHVLVGAAGGYMALVCFKNGALAIEKMRAHYGLDWDGFEQALMKAPLGNNGGILLPYFEPEIVPRLNAGFCRFNIDPDDAAGNCRALVEAQAMSMRLHSRWVNTTPKVIYATGGVSVNRSVLQVMADVFDCPIVPMALSNSAALGAALRAAYAFYVQKGELRSWGEITSGFCRPLRLAQVNPSSGCVEVYRKLIETYARCEAEAALVGS